MRYPRLTEGSIGRVGWEERGGTINELQTEK